MEKESLNTPENSFLKGNLPEVPTVLEVDNKVKPEEEKVGVKINAKDYAWLKKNNYEEARRKFKTTYILQHKKFPDKIVELRAASSFHACNMIHWKPKQVRLLGIKTESGDIVDAIRDQSVQTTSNTSLI